MNTAAAHGATVSVHDIGATVVSWTVDGEEQLFVSPNAVYRDGKAIRGGIPVCWPWFAGDQPGPSHGVARDRPWTRLDSPDGSLRFELRDSPATREVWPHAFRFVLDVVLHPRALSVTLTHENLDPKPVVATGALHTYLATDRASARLDGLDQAWFFDKLTGQTRAVDVSLRFDRPIDAIVHRGGTTTLVDAHRIRAIHTSSDTFVVWNPGADKAASMSDLGAGQHDRFVCVEAAVTGEERAELAPGGTFALTTRIAVP